MSRSRYTTPKRAARSSRSAKRWRIQHGDCVAAMRKLEAASIDAIVTDPPYGLGFMGKDWDSPSVNGSHEQWVREALRVLKPGGHLLAFGGTRTFHRLACGLEDAGFEIRDTLMWLYGQGFPKSTSVPLAIDKANGHPARGRAIPVASSHLPSGRYAPTKLTSNPVCGYRSRSATAAAWQGWGTALKPAWEPIVLARKPLTGTIAANVLAHSTGALNIDGCRVAFAGPADEHESKTKNRHGQFSSAPRANTVYGADTRKRGDYDAPGRWPANVLLAHTKHCRPAGTTRVQANGHHPARRPAGGLTTTGHKGQQQLVERRSSDGEIVQRWHCPPECPVRMLDEQSDAARFFYCAKASTVEREAGLHGLTKGRTSDGRAKPIDNPYQRGTTIRANTHPTVKPIELMRWIVRLITPPGGTVLDPFTGSGSTGIAAILEDARFIGIEQDTEYARIARARIRHWAPRASSRRPPTHGRA